MTSLPRGGGRRSEVGEKLEGNPGWKRWGCCQKVKAIRHTPKKMRPAATKLKREMAVVKMEGEKSKC